MFDEEQPAQNPEFQINTYQHNSQQKGLQKENRHNHKTCYLKITNAAGVRARDDALKSG